MENILIYILIAVLAFIAGALFGGKIVAIVVCLKVRLEAFEAKEKASVSLEAARVKAIFSEVRAFLAEIDAKAKADAEKVKADAAAVASAVVADIPKV